MSGGSDVKKSKANNSPEIKGLFSPLVVVSSGFGVCCY